MSAPRCSIVIPARNERDNIAALLDDILRMYGDFEIVIVDDNSCDGTGEICQRYAKKHENVICIRRGEGSNGMGFALVKGTKSSRGEYVFWVMGDRSDELYGIGKMLEMLERGYDMVIASRYMRGGSRGDLDLHKALYGAVYTRMASIIFGIPVDDITNAYRGFRKEIIDEVGGLSGTFSISPEFAIKAHLAGYRIGQIPTTYFNRRAGQPKFNLLKMGVEYVGLFRLRFGTGGSR